jgi:hypothetical protein
MSTHRSQLSQPIAKQGRIVLTPDLAMEIYAHKVRLQTPTDCCTCFNTSMLLKGQSGPIAKKYQVSAKTIRDIWNRRTWTFATCSLWRGEVTSSAESIPYSQVYLNLIAFQVLLLLTCTSVVGCLRTAAAITPIGPHKSI